MEESLFTKQTVQCPICFNEFEATIWQRVEADSDPDLKDKLLRKDLQAQQCANCGHTWLPAGPLLYRETTRQLMVYSHAGQSEKVARQVLASLPALPGWTLRLVPDTNRLIEKIHISDHHCDDRLVEFVKLAVKRQGLEDAEAAIDQLYFLTADDQAFRFLVTGGDGGWYTLDLESTIYLNAEVLAEGKLPDQRGQWLIIGEAYADDLLRRLAEG